MRRVLDVKKQRADLARLDRLFGFDRKLGAPTIQTGRGPARNAAWRARQRRKAATT